MAAPPAPRPGSGHRPALLIVLDGFAWGDAGHVCNAVKIARTPCFDRLRATCPNVELHNNGPHVGLPPGQMGNSEVGHLNIGAGRVVYQDFMRINNAIRTGAFGSEAAIQAAFAHLRHTGGRLHLMGLLGPGGVHAHESHMGAALKAAAKAGLKQVWVHPVTDGRDTPPRSALGYLGTLKKQIAEAGVGKIADVVGRYYAMDRDNRWDRIQQAYVVYAQEAPLDHSNRAMRTAEEVIERAYASGVGDEFIPPTRLEEEGNVRSGDAVIWLNFRPDRSRQVTRAFMDPAFAGFARTQVKDLSWVCMTSYDATFTQFPRLIVAYPPQAVEDCLAEHLSKLGLPQFHTAETEKYAHVTYFLNGGREAPFPGEQRKLVPSQKVATYDLAPEMSAGPVTDEVLLAMGSGGYDFVVVNFANPDMVGHTGKLDATIKAVEFTDNCVHRLTSVATELGFVTLITSDHGNAEEMCKVNADGSRGEPVTKHTMNPSPLILVNGRPGESLRDGGALENVAPTLLDLMGLPIPAAMTAKSLVVRA